MNRALLMWQSIMLLILVLAGVAYGAEIREDVPAERILEMIKNGEPVEYYRVNIIGDINLSELPPTAPVEQSDYLNIGRFEFRQTSKGKAKVINSSLNITDSNIKGFINLKNAIFQKEVNFQYTNFNKGANFNNVQFNGDANFWGSRFGVVI